MGSVTLRRQKDNVGLAEKKDDVIRLVFSDEEKRIYSEFASQGNLELKKMLSRDSRLHGKSYAHVLRSLYRLRAICAHGLEMLGEEDKKLLEGTTASMAIELGDDPENGPNDSFISEKHGYDALYMMIDGEVDECSGCGRKISERSVDPEVITEDSENSDSEIDSQIDPSRSSSTDPDANVMGYLTPCYHLFCSGCKDNYVQECIPKFTKDEYHACTYCGQYVRFGLFTLLRSGLQAMLDARDKAKQKGKQAKWDEATYSGPHTKVKALLAGLKQSAEESALLPPDEPPIRSVVFSGWTQYLDLIEYALEQHNIKFVRLDGSMTVKARTKVLSEFKTDPDITVLLVSIKAGGQGLNFTAASRVYMMEPQYNPGVELQAIDRVHRIGQQRNVEVVHYIMTDSVEEKILDLQERKMELARMTVEKNLSKAEEAKQKIEYLRDLFK
jgi:SNF2 family DNA or RNA helicase